MQWFKARLQGIDLSFDLLFAGLIGVLALYYRWFLWGYRTRMPAGDTFNFLNATEALKMGLYPIAEKRPPLYSALIVIAEFFIHDPIRAAHIVSIICGAGALAVVYFIGRHFKIYRPVLAALLALAVFDPLLSLYGVRALSQSIFFFVLSLAVLLVLKARREWWYLILLAASLVSLPLTRPEGALIALVLWISLFFKLNWRRVVAVAGIACVLLVPWFVVVARSTGSPFKLPGSGEYALEFSSGERGTTDIVQVLRGVGEVSEGTWDRGWVSPAEVGIATFAMGILAVIGLGWLLATKPKDGLIYAVTFGLVALIAAWYRASGKYSSPFSSTWYVCAAAGLTAIGFILQRLILKNKGVIGGLIGTLLAIILVATTLPVSANVTTGTVIGDMGLQWAQVEAARYVAQQTGAVLFSDTTLMSLLYLGRVGRSDYPPERGLYLAEILATSAEQQRSALVENHVQYIVDDGAENLQPLIKLLLNRHEITLDRLFTSSVPDDDKDELIRVYRFNPAS